IKIIVDLKDLKQQIKITEKQLELFSEKLEETDLNNPIKINNEFLEIGKEMNKSFLVIIFIYLSFAGKDIKKWPEIKIEVKSKLPIGAGLGSSASYNTGIVIGMMEKFSIGKT